MVETGFQLGRLAADYFRYRDYCYWEERLAVVAAVAVDMYRLGRRREGWVLMMGRLVNWEVRPETSSMLMYSLVYELSRETEKE